MICFVTYKLFLHHNQSPIVTHQYLLYDYCLNMFQRLIIALCLIKSVMVSVVYISNM